LTTQSARFIGAIPENYDRGLGPRIFHAYGAELAARAADSSPMSVLEIAAGTGIVTRKLRDLLPANSTITATDLNLPMLEVAKSKFTHGESVIFEQADAQQLAYNDARFDSIVCQFSVMFFPDKARSYREALRVLRPGAAYHFNVWNSQQENSFAQITQKTVAGFFPDDPPGFYNVPFGYHDHEEIRRSLLAAGFDTVEIESRSSQSDIPSAADFAQGLIFGNPVIDEIADRNGNPDEICTALTTALDRELGSEMPLSATFVCATAPG